MATKGDISGLDHLMFGGEYLVPVINGSRKRRSSLAQSSSGAGFTRQRKIMHGVVYEQSATYYLETAAQQDFIKLFFERNEGKKFIGYTSADRPLVEPYVMQVISEWEDESLTAIDAELNVTLEIMSVRDSEFDDALFEFYQANGDEVAAAINLYAQITKEMPTP